MALSLALLSGGTFGWSKNVKILSLAFLNDFICLAVSLF